MNKAEFVAAVAAKAELSKKDSASGVDAMLTVLQDQMVAGDSVSFTGFGTFGVKDVPEREARNPQTGESMMIPAHRSPYFKAGKTLKDAVK